MVAISDSDWNEILEKLDSIHASLTQTISRVESRIVKGEEAFEFFNDGLAAFKKRHLQETSQLDFQAKWLARIKNDPELRFPHRKILEFLLNQYDFETRTFGKVHFSRLVKLTRVGKNRAKDYLALLIRKNYVEEESDGYRVFYSLRKISENFPAEKTQTF